MRSLGYGGVHRIDVAVFPQDRGVVAVFRVDDRRLRQSGRHQIDADRQFVHFQFDEFGRILGLILRLGDHRRHGLADEAHAIGWQYRPVRNETRRSVPIPQLRPTRQAAELGEIRTGVDGEHAGGDFRLSCV